MFPQKAQIIPNLESETYPLGEKIEPSSNGAAMALVALTHTPLEQRLYLAMLASLEKREEFPQAFTVRRLMQITNISSQSTIRRGLEGLVVKLSVERENRSNGDGARDRGVAYRVFAPDEIIARRNERGIKPYAKGIESRELKRSFERVVQRVAENQNLSRREAQVALCCVEGLTNAQIGTRLLVTEQTVKFHLRHVFIKFGVKRRAELISRLLM